MLSAKSIMFRWRRFFIFACFLVAIASNSIQATHISASRVARSERLLRRVPNGEQTDASAFVIPEDDPDGTPTVIVARTAIANIQSAILNLRLKVSTAVAATPAERHTVLRL